MLAEADAIGARLPLMCALHLETITQVESVADFDLYVKDGGCSLPCTTRLSCDHTCPR
jgi:hypothetical protein